MKKNIELNIVHNNAKRMEFFLNRINDELVEVSFDWRKLKNSNLIHDACKFVQADMMKSLTISIIFCDSYQDANEIGRVNELPFMPNSKWSVNGDVLYVVESKDAEKVSSILGLFAGEE